MFNTDLNNFMKSITNFKHEILSHTLSIDTRSNESDAHNIFEQ